jgi:hypothetical protein
MKKRDRVIGIEKAILRFGANVLGNITEAKGQLAREVVAEVLGTLSVAEGNELIEKKKWTPEILARATELGLVFEKTTKVRKPRSPRTTDGAGNIQTQFKSKHPELAAGTQAFDDEAKALLVDFVNAYGVDNTISVVRGVVDTTEFKLSTYYMTKERYAANLKKASKKTTAETPPTPGTPAS